MIRLPFVFFALVAVLGACSKSPALPPPAAAKPAVVTAAPITAVANPTPSLQDHMLRTSAIAAVAPPLSPAVPKPDTALPFDRYTALPPMEQNPLGYLKAAYFSSPLTEEQKLLMVSPRLAAEPDAFKRHEMMAAEEKVMAERLAGYAAQRYYAVPVGSGHALQFLGPPSGVTLMLDAYDFDRKAFPIGRIRDGQPPVMGRGCDAMPFSVVKQVQSPEDMQRQIMSGKPLATLSFIPIQMTGSELPCFLSVPDEATAKRIEAARVSQPGIHPIAFTTGTLYLYVTGAGDDGVHATVVHAHLNLGVFSMKHPAPDPLAEVNL